MRKSYRRKVVYTDLKCNFMKVEKQLGVRGAKPPNNKRGGLGGCSFPNNKRRGLGGCSPPQLGTNQVSDRLGG